MKTMGSTESIYSLMQNLRNSYGERMWRQEVMGEFSNGLGKAADRADALAYAMEIMNQGFDEKEAKEHGINQLEKSLKEDMCRKCKKSVRNGIRINDVVTLHRIMGEYWIYHMACFEEMAGPEAVPPQKKITLKEREEPGIPASIPKWKSVGLHRSYTDEWEKDEAQLEMEEAGRK